MKIIYFNDYYFIVIVEMVNLCDAEKFKSLMDWDGCSINVQHLNMDLISHNFIQKLKKSRDEPQESQQHKNNLPMETDSTEKTS